MDDPVTTAINAALIRDWKQAIKLNLIIFKQNPKDIQALNRLARAYFETGHKSKAQSLYQKVLHIDKFDSIATKSLELLKTSRLPKRPASSSSQSPLPPPMFLEEPGITKTISLIRLGDPKIISRLHPGDPVTITPRDHCVSVTSQNQYLGRLPDDLTSRLLPLLRSGNRYHAWIRSVDGGLKVFIKEIYKSPKHRETPSFPITEKLSYAAFTPPELVHTEKPDVSETEDQEEAGTSLVDQDLDESAPETPGRPGS